MTTLKDVARAFRTSPAAAALTADAFSGAIRIAVEQEAARLRDALPRQGGLLAASASEVQQVYRIFRPSFGCRIGFHRWKYFARVLWAVIDMGDRMKRCERCGKERRA